MPWRDFALTSVFAWFLMQALRHTWIGALLWTWLSLMNPHRLTYSFAFNLPFAQTTAVATLLSIWWNKGKVRLPADASVVALVLFVLWTCITTYFALLPTPAAVILIKVVKIQLMTLICIAAIRERKHIELFIWVNVLSIGFYGFKGGLFAIATGGSSRVWGPTDSFIEDNNALGLSLVMIIPLGYYLWQVATRRWLRWGMGLFLVMCSVAVLATQSRGAFLAIVAMVLVLWTRTRQKVAAGIALAFVGAILVSNMPASWEDRMRTIGNYEQDVSAMQRLNAWTTAINVADDRITGAGFSIAYRSIFVKYSPNPDWVYTAHSIYFQALGEHGWIGLMLFLSMGTMCFRNTWRIRKQARRRKEVAWVYDLMGMLQVSMVGFAVGGAFLSLTYFDLPYNILVVIVAVKYWMLEERWKNETSAVFAGGTMAQNVPAKQARSW